VWIVFLKYRFLSKLVDLIDFLQGENEIFCEDFGNILLLLKFGKIDVGVQKMVKIMHP